MCSTGQRLGNGRIANKESFDGERGLSSRQLLCKKTPASVRRGRGGGGGGGVGDRAKVSWRKYIAVVKDD